MRFPNAPKNHLGGLSATAYLSGDALREHVIEASIATTGNASKKNSPSFCWQLHTKQSLTMRIIFPLLLTLFQLLATAQKTPQKIKVILLGTFHFNQSLDSNSRLHSNLFSAQRQKEVDEIVTQLAKQKPDKIFLEFTPKDQAYYDSIYHDYLQGKEPERLRTKANEIFQLGMKTAKKAGLKGVIGMNYQPADLADSTYKPLNDADAAVQNLYKALDRFNDTTRSNAAFYDLPYPYKQAKLDSFLQKATLTQFLLHLNTPQLWQYEEYTNWNYFYSIGADNMNATDYVGTFWYGTNVRNYNNVVRRADLIHDKCYLIIYGNSHISLLKYLFEQNPFFEVVEAKSVLK